MNAATGQAETKARRPRRRVALCSTAVAVVGVLMVPGEQQPVQEISFRLPAADGATSPANCKIVFVDNPHFSKSVPGGLKVNSKSQCDKPVEENSLSVTLFGDNMTELRETVVKSNNKNFVENQSTYIMCKNTTDMHTFQGAAMGTSFEDGKPYVQFKFGKKVQVPCGY